MNFNRVFPVHQNQSVGKKNENSIPNPQKYAITKSHLKEIIEEEDHHEIICISLNLPDR